MRATRESGRPRAVTPLPPAGRGTRSLTTRAVAVKRPRPVSVRGSRPVTTRPRASTPRAVAVRRPRRSRRERAREESDADDDRCRRSRPLDREQEEERERKPRRRPRELLSRVLALLSFLDPHPEERESREDKTREQEADDSLKFPRCGTCGENWGESTASETREMGVCSERATPAPPPPEGEGEGEEGARPPAPDECLEALPPLSLDRDRAGGEEAPTNLVQRAVLTRGRKLDRPIAFKG